MASGAKPEKKPLHLSFMTEVKPLPVQTFIATLANYLQQGFNELHLLLTTPGGNVREGIALYNVLRALPMSVYTYNVGSVNSIGNVIYLAGSRRYASPTSSFMFHGVGFDITNARFEEKNLREKLDGLMNDQGLIADIIIDRTKLSRKDVQKLFLAEAFVRPDDAKAKGIVHSISDIKVPEGATFVQLVFQ